MSLSKRLIFCFASVLLVSACASKPPAVMTDRDYYEAAQQAMKSGNFQTAIQKLEDLESHYPVGPYTEQAQLESVYAHYKHLDFGGAAAAADRFIRLHPAHPQLDYVYYIKGLADYEADRGMFDRYTPTNTAHRDIGAGRDAFNDFKELLARFPESRYAPDARQRMVFIRNQIAEGELHAARYYIRRGAHVAAANRARWVLENYPSTPSVPEALAIMSVAYDRLNQKDLAEGARKMLKSNYPDYRGYDDKGNIVLELGPRAFRRSLLNVFTFGLLGTRDEA